MIYLKAENASSLGEDTFWTWFHREFPKSSFQVPATIGPRDAVLQYSTMGASHVRGGKRVALLWELHPELIEQKVPGKWDEPMRRISECALTSDYRVVATPFVQGYYAQYGQLHCLPIAVDGEIFKPRDKAAMREKHRLPKDKRLAFWGGTTHFMKGFDRVLEYAQANPDVHFVCAWKKAGGHFRGHTNVTAVRQDVLAELMCACDFQVVAGRLRPFYMIEWEAMACDVPVVNISGLQKDFEPGDHPREDVEARGWLRVQAKGTWADFLTKTVGATL